MKGSQGGKAPLLGAAVPFLLTDTNHRDEACFPKDTAHRSIKDSKRLKANMIMTFFSGSLSSSHPEI